MYSVSWFWHFLVLEIKLRNGLSINNRSYIYTVDRTMHNEMRACIHTGLARYEFYFKFWDIGGVLICGPAFSRNCRWRFIWFWPILTAHVLLLSSYLPNERSTCKQNKKICAICIKCDKMAWPRTCYQNFQSRQHIH